MRVTGVERIYHTGNRFYRKPSFNSLVKRGVNFSNDQKFIDYVAGLSGKTPINVAVSMTHSNGSCGYLYTMIAVANGGTARYMDDSPRSHEYDEGPFNEGETKGEFKRHLMGLARAKCEVTDLGGLEFSVSKR